MIYTESGTEVYTEAETLPYTENDQPPGKVIDTTDPIHLEYVQGAEFGDND